MTLYDDKEKGWAENVNEAIDIQDDLYRLAHRFTERFPGLSRIEDLTFTLVSGMQIHYHMENIPLAITKISFKDERRVNG